MVRPTCTLRLSVALVAMLLLAPALHLAHASAYSTEGSAPEREKMIERTYKVDRGDRLDISVSDADLIVETADILEARIEIWLESSTMENARTYFEEQNFSVEQDGRTVLIYDDPPRRMRYNWRSLRDTHIEVRVVIPMAFDADLRTSDGDIDLEAIEGRVELSSSDGDITTERIAGPSISVRTSDGNIMMGSLRAERIECQTSDGDVTIASSEGETIRLRSSDGDLRATSLRGDLDLHTSDGDIEVDTADGVRIRVRTSDGTIRLGTLRTDEASVQTSDGDIRIRALSGGIRATTSSGDIDVAFAIAGASYLRTGDGDITIIVPSATDADLDFSAEDVRVASGLRFEGRLDDDQADGQIGRGGPLLEARSSDGSITLRSR